MPEQDAIIPLESNPNLRDAGWPLRRGVLFRSGSPYAATPNDIAALQMLGIRTLIDLRDNNERTKQAYHFNGFRYVYSPVYRGISQALLTPLAPLLDRHPLDALYDLLLAGSTKQFGRVVAALAEPDALPALIHCTLGKDRTGLTIALILSALGVPDQAIVDDYVLTARSAADAIAAQAQHMRAHPLRARFLPLLSADARHMARALARLHTRYGGATAYLKRAGVTQDQFDRLRQAMNH
jgi:protein-tyrosine phosphatase